jgi:uncharacterized damage-inducible protein DinB
MFTAVRHFTTTWTHETGSTGAVLAALTEPSLAQQVAEGHRTLGELAWHVVVSPKTILSKVGLDFDGPTKDDPMPVTLEEVRLLHAASANALLAAVQEHWSDEALHERVEFYGMEAPRGGVRRRSVAHRSHAWRSGCPRQWERRGVSSEMVYDRARPGRPD